MRWKQATIEAAKLLQEGITKRFKLKSEINQKDRLHTCPFSVRELFLWTIKGIAHLLYDLFTVPTTGTRFAQSNELIIKPGIWLAEVGIYVFSGKDQREISICILQAFCQDSANRRRAGRPVFDPIIEFTCVISGSAGFTLKVISLAGWQRKAKSFLLRVMSVNQPHPGYLQP